MHTGRDVVRWIWSTSVSWSDLGQGIAESRDPFCFREESKRVKLTLQLRVPISKIFTLVKGIAR